MGFPSHVWKILFHPKFVTSICRGLHRFQHCTGHITTNSWKGRGNQYIQLVKVLYCKLPTKGKQLPAFPLEDIPGIEPIQRWEARGLPSICRDFMTENYGYHLCVIYDNFYFCLQCLRDLGNICFKGLLLCLMLRKPQ